MIELVIKGTNYKDIKKQIFELANDIATDTDDSLEIQPASVRESALQQPAPTPVVNHAEPVAQAEAPKRTRRSKAEIEADRLAKLQAAQAEVQQAQASHAPITIPQVPTTQHVVSIPTAHVVETHAPVIQPPTPQVAPPGAYTLNTFKTNIVMIINSLLSTGKLNSQWIADTSTKVFGGADIWLWSQNEPKITELFAMFIEWGFIQEFKG